jgi:hypothetical protein
MMTRKNALARKSRLSQALEELLSFSAETEFDETGAPSDLQKALFAASFLLEYSSNSGNDPVDGSQALGFSKLLSQCTRDLAQIERFYVRQISNLKGEISNLKEGIAKLRAGQRHEK